MFCLRDFGASIPAYKSVNLTNCPRSNREQTGVLEENNDNLTFTLGQPFPNSSNHSMVPNPVQLHGTNWTVSAIIIIDSDLIVRVNTFSSRVIYLHSDTDILCFM